MDKRVVVPMNKVLIRVTRDDVIHSWSIPSIRIKMDAVPGKHNIAQFTPIKCGVFYGQCAELCGVNHSYMPIVLEVVPREFFDRWFIKQGYFSEGFRKYAGPWDRLPAFRDPVGSFEFKDRWPRRAVESYIKD